MSKEIERKFYLPSGVLPNIVRHSPNIEPIQQVQGYLLVSENLEQRIRKESIPAGVSCYLTVKTGGTLIREECEMEVSEQIFNEMWKNVASKAIEKNRFKVYEEETCFEVDEYLQPGAMIIVEIEFSSEKEAANFQLPAWMEGAIEVTDDKRFKAKNIAMNGIPELRRVS